MYIIIEYNMSSIVLLYYKGSYSAAYSITLPLQYNTEYSAVAIKWPDMGHSALYCT